MLRRILYLLVLQSLPEHKGANNDLVKYNPSINKPIQNKYITYIKQKYRRNTEHIQNKYSTHKEQIQTNTKQIQNKNKTNIKQIQNKYQYKTNTKQIQNKYRTQVGI